MITENDPKQIKYRLMISNMRICAYAGIMFGIWSLLRFSLYYSLLNVDLSVTVSVDYVRKIVELIPATYREMVDSFLYSGLLLSLVLDLILRCYIGQAAIVDSEAKKRKTPVYIILAVLLGLELIQDALYQMCVLPQLKETDKLIDDMTASALLDMASAIAYIVLAISAMGARTLRKRLKKEGKSLSDLQGGDALE